MENVIACVHDLVEIFRRPDRSLYEATNVVRWCSKCGSVVVDTDLDGRTKPGDLMKMRSPASATLAATPPSAAPAEPNWENPPPAIDARLGVWLTSGSDDLNPHTKNLVVRFARAMAKKLLAAEQKYGYTDGWRTEGWMDECRAKLLEHIAKGDPVDVANYCAFLWFHGASTASVPAGEVQGDAARAKIPAYTINVPVGDGAFMCIVNPVTVPQIGYSLTYSGDLNQPQAGRFSAAALIDSYNYLVSHDISLKEATRRLALMRQARDAAIAANKAGVSGGA